LPFLSNGVKIETNAKTLLAEPAMPPKRRFQSGVEMSWPKVKGLNGNDDDASLVKPPGVDNHSELAYLSGYEPNGYYRILDQKSSIGFGLKWDASLFKYLWYWQERYGLDDAPWWGNVYTVALEPWTAKWTDDPEKGIENGDWEKLEAKETLTTIIKAFAIYNSKK
jgi:hypothetical protein